MIEPNDRTMGSSFGKAMMQSPRKSMMQSMTLLQEDPKLARSKKSKKSELEGEWENRWKSERKRKDPPEFAKLARRWITPQSIEASPGTSYVLKDLRVPRVSRNSRESVDDDPGSGWAGRKDRGAHVKKQTRFASRLGLKIVGPRATPLESEKAEASGPQETLVLSLRDEETIIPPAARARWKKAPASSKDKISSGNGGGRKSALHSANYTGQLRKEKGDRFGVAGQDEGQVKIFSSPSFSCRVPFGNVVCKCPATMDCSHKFVGKAKSSLWHMIDAKGYGGNIGFRRWAYLA